MRKQHTEKVIATNTAMITKELLFQKPIRILEIKNEIIAIINISPVSNVMHNNPEIANNFERYAENQLFPLFWKQSAASIQAISLMWGLKASINIKLPTVIIPYH